jgi:Phage tail assembly chaperone proteins, E, or 41 or 14
MEHTLKYPFEHQGQPYDTLKIRRPKGRDFKALDRVNGEMARVAHLISNLCEISPEAVEEIDGEDFVSLSQIVGALMDGTGGTAKGNVRTV